MRCQCCGNVAPTKYVEFYQNVGALVVRFSKSVKGELCKRCINEYFTKFTLTTVAVGWLGIISAIVTPFIVLNNIVRFCGTIGMKAARAAEPTPADHPTLSLTREAAAKIEPFRQEMQIRLNAGEALDRVSMNVAQRAGVSAVQVEMYLENMGK
jgi:hypothetical protein